MLDRHSKGEVENPAKYKGSFGDHWELRPEQINAEIRVSDRSWETCVTVGNTGLKFHLGDPEIVGGISGEYKVNSYFIPGRYYYPNEVGTADTLYTFGYALGHFRDWVRETDELDLEMIGRAVIDNSNEEFYAFLKKLFSSSGHSELLMEGVMDAVIIDVKAVLELPEDDLLNRTIDWLSKRAEGMTIQVPYPGSGN